MINHRLRNFLLLLFIINLCDARRYKCNKTLSCGCSSSNVEINARIINGEEAIPYSWSMIVSIRYDFLHISNIAMHMCGGTILTDSYILTAANCLEDIRDDVKLANISIAAGIHRRSQSRQIIREVDQIIIHPNWTGSRNGHHHDIALLHLSKPLDFEINPSITQTCLPPQLNTDEEIIQYPTNSTTLAVIGWGRIGPFADDSDMLKQIIFYSIDYTDSKCANIISDPKRQFCAGLTESNAGPCYVDFGGPILQWMEDHWEQVGITSFATDICQKDSPIGYTRIAYYRDWIESYIHRNNPVTEETSVIMTITPMNVTEITSDTYYCDRYTVPCGCGRRNVHLSHSRIVNGDEAIPFSWSMIVSIRLNGTDHHSCSGSILTESFILTSASCIADGSSFGITIAAGIHNHSDDDRTHRKIDRIYIHPDYNGILDNHANDIAILHISQPFEFDLDPLVSRTCLPQADELLRDSISYPSPGARLAVIGWGYTNYQNRTDPHLLQQAEVYAMSYTADCCNVMDVHDRFKFCAGVDGGGKVPCIGDSGSPIFYWVGDRWQQVGIASSVNHCEDIRSLGVYTRLATYYNWIQSIVDSCLTPLSSTATTITTTIVSMLTTTTATIKRPVFYQCNRKSSCGCGPTPVVLTPSRIVGGENAVDYSWPMIVSLRFLNDEYHWCGGTILSNSYILTAAHCLHEYVENSPKNLKIAIGMTNLSDPRQIRHIVDHMYIHPDYKGISDNYRHDIALLHLDQSLTFEHNPFLTKTCIHRVGSSVPNNQYIKGGTRLAVIGWGTTNHGIFYTPEILQQTEVYAIDNNHPICRSSMNDSETQFCAGLLEGGKDACQGDSGGPIFQWTGQYWEQIGIVSHGDGCAKADSPGIYTRLSYYYDWINGILKNNTEYLEPDPSTYETTIKPNITTATNTPTVSDITTTSNSTENACNHQQYSLSLTILFLLIVMIIQ